MKKLFLISLLFILASCGLKYKKNKIYDSNKKRKSEKD